ncbi:MAG: sigma 54 modulation/S30EA ribosomal C-terminal domain-containing protein, partial [Negativicoccus succinicivorans]|nr:sigma 54 modulation/S30EA ribosomal C-terminal domain-containing protein [Negativicoccus succinicivorans]
IHKYKTRLAKRFKGRQVLNDKFLTPHTPAGNEAESESFEVVRHKSFDMKPMSTEEAILQMSLLDHDFFVFKNEETDLISVIYKRDDGKYGIIETKE